MLKPQSKISEYDRHGKTEVEGRSDLWSFVQVWDLFTQSAMVKQVNLLR